jgi:DHA1 family inner membrane transport protein
VDYSKIAAVVEYQSRSIALVWAMVNEPSVDALSITLTVSACVEMDTPTDVFWLKVKGTVPNGRTSWRLPCGPMVGCQRNHRRVDASVVTAAVQPTTTVTARNRDAIRLPHGRNNQGKRQHAAAADDHRMTAMLRPTHPATRFAMRERMPWALLLAASLAMFTVAASGTTRAPFLIDMARDLSASVPLIANLVAITSVAWGITSIFAGAGSDRWGTRPFLIGGPLGLALATVGVATGGSFLSVAVWGTIAGGFCGLFSGTVFTEVSSRVLPTQQGRALGWVMSGQSLTLLVGVPLAAWVGSWIGWRGVNVCIAALALITTVCLLAATTRRTRIDAIAAARVPSMRAALSRPVLRLLAMGIAERICYGLVAVYYATFLQSTYALSLEEVALPLGVFAIGNILGTLLGGQLAARLQNRLVIFAAAMLASGSAALALFGWQVDVQTSVALGFGYVFFNAIARPSLMASLSDVPEHVRGTVMGMNVTSNSIGWLGAAGLGGWMIGSFGFAGFGPLAAAVAMIGAGLALIRRR